MIPRLPIFKNTSSFTFLNLSQFLICLNDSIFRLLVVYSLIDMLGVEKSNVILSITGFLFILPYLLFSMPAGQLADRYSKKKLILWMMVFEIGAIGFGVWATYGKIVWGSYLALFLVALQSALYSPARAAIVPEIVPEADITKANGYLSLASYGAVLLGIFVASFVSEITHRNYTLIALMSLGFSVMAFFLSLGIQKTPVQNPKKKIEAFFFFELYRSIKEARLYPLLFVTLIASAFFYFTAGFTQLNTLPFGVQSLGLTDLQTGYIFMGAAFGVGVGSYWVILLSGKNVELGLSIWGAFGTALSYMLLYSFQHSLFISILLVISLGIHGGLFIVPMNAYIQIIAPDKDRGSIIAAGNFINFVLILAAPALIYLFGEKLYLTGAESFFCVGILCFFVGLWFAFKAPYPLTRLCGIITSKFFLKVSFQGDYEEDTFKKSSLLICSYPTFRALLSLVQMFPKITFIRFIRKDPSRFSSLVDSLFQIYPLRLDLSLEKEALHLKDQLAQGSFLCLFLQGRKNRSLSEEQKNAIDLFLDHLQESALPIEIHLHKRSCQTHFKTKLNPPFHIETLIHTFHSKESPLG